MWAAVLPVNNSSPAPQEIETRSKTLAAHYHRQRQALATRRAVFRQPDLPYALKCLECAQVRPTSHCGCAHLELIRQRAQVHHSHPPLHRIPCLGTIVSASNSASLVFWTGRRGFAPQLTLRLFDER